MFHIFIVLRFQMFKKKGPFESNTKKENIRILFNLFMNKKIADSVLLKLFMNTN